MPLGTRGWPPTSSLGTSACARMSRRPTRTRQRPLFLRAMPTYSSNARKSPRRKEGISPTPAPVWLPNLSTRCPPCFDCPPGETSRFPRGNLANLSEVTQILSAIERGDARAAEQLLPLVYEELRQLAAQKLAQERPGQTLQATALVHEAYLRLVGGEPDAHWNSRGHFIAAAAEAMRRILVENARRKQSKKRGGQRRRIDLSQAEPLDQADPDALLDLDELLTLLAGEDPEAAAVAKLRIFAGLSVEEAAQALSTSRASAYRQWTYARAWLHARLGAGPGSS